MAKLTHTPVDISSFSKAIAPAALQYLQNDQD